MSLQTRLFLQFILIGLLPLVIVFLLILFTTQQQFIDRSLASIEGIADIQEEHLNSILDDYITSSRLVGSRTQMRIELDNYLNTSSTQSLEKVDIILTQAIASGTSIESISLYDIQNSLIYSSDSAVAEMVDEDILRSARDQHRLGKVFKDEQNLIKIDTYGPIYNEQGEIIATSRIVSSASPLLKITDDYTGLGETGEILLVQKNASADAVVINPLRFDTGASLQRAIFSSQIEKPTIVAISGTETILKDGKSFDYRGEPVYAVTRYIDSADWGLVVKVDVLEVDSYSDQITTIFSLAFLLTLLAVFAVSFLIAGRISKPITGMINQTEKIANGAFSDEVSNESEIKELAALSDSINRMSRELGGLYEGLDRKVKDRTRSIELEKAKVESILSYVGDGLILLDAKGNVSFINNSATKILGITDHLIQEDFRKVLNFSKIDSDETLLSEDIDRIYLSKSKKRKVVQRKSYLSLSGRKKVACVFTVSDYFVKNKREGVIIIFRDITEELRIDKVKSEFVSLASHQLRTPLSVIRWFSELLISGDSGELNQKQKLYVENIYKSNLRMLDLVNSLLNVARIEANNFIVNPEYVLVREVIDAVISGFKTELDKRGIAIEIQGSDESKIFIDRDIMRVIIENLLSNAIKYSYEKGKIDIIIEEDKKNIYINIRDYGLGIPAKQQSRIFEKLFRADNASEHDTDGNGLGLYIIKGIIEQIDGEIKFSSKEGDGTTFIVRLSKDGIKKKEGSKKII